MKQVSTYQIYHAEDLITPSDYTVLTGESRLQCNVTPIDLTKIPQGETADQYTFNLTPKGIFNIGCIEIPSNVKNYIKNISASLLENYTVSAKSITPIVCLKLLSSPIPTLDFLKSIPESKLLECSFNNNGIQFNNKNIKTYSDIKGLFLNQTDNRAIVDNVFITKHDTINEFPYFPNKYKAYPSILDTLHFFYSISFSDTIDLNFNDLIIPSGDKYLFAFMTASLPIPYSTISVKTSTVSVKAIVNLSIESI